LERLRAREWRVTPQRRAVAEVLSGEHVHLTAEAVHAAAQTRLPEISLATVYNTLNELVAMGEVLEVAAGPGPKRYDPNVTVAHHHLVCTACGTLRDVVPDAASLQALRANDLHGFVVTGVELVFQGLCPSCAAAA
jgi:Fur family ferric uptake transcriptional regulator